MLELFLTALGKYARMFIDWYVRNTLVLSSVVVCYGLILAMAANNLARVEGRLKTMLGAENAREISDRLAHRPLTEDELASLRKGLLLPIVTSPNHVFFRTIQNASLLKIFTARAGV